MQFECPYHGWVYDPSGRLIGVPAEKQMYRDGLDRGSFTLRRARVEVRHGLVFGKWPQEPPSSAESFGDFGFYLDMYLGSTNGGWEVAGPASAVADPCELEDPRREFCRRRVPLPVDAPFGRERCKCDSRDDVEEPVRGGDQRSGERSRRRGDTATSRDTGE